jgi:hypothetical protein
VGERLGEALDHVTIPGNKAGKERLKSKTRSFCAVLCVVETPVPCITVLMRSSGE